MTIGHLIGFIIGGVMYVTYSITILCTVDYARSWKKGVKKVEIFYAVFLALSVIETFLLYFLLIKPLLEEK